MVADIPIFNVNDQASNGSPPRAILLGSFSSPGVVDKFGGGGPPMSGISVRAPLFGSDPMPVLGNNNLVSCPFLGRSIMNRNNVLSLTLCGQL